MRITHGAVAALVAAVCAVGVRDAASQDRADRQSEGLIGPVRVVTGEAWDGRRGESRQGERRKPIDTVTFDTKGTVLERRSYSYGAGGERVAMAVVGADNQGYEAWYVRAAGGRLERITYVVKGVEMGHTAFTYGDGPDPAAVAFFLPTGAQAVAPVGPCLGAHRITSRYADGKVTEQTLFEPDGAEKRRSIFTYDAAGNVTSETRSEPFGERRITHVYAYDRRGNWITRTTTFTRTDRFAPGAPPSTSVSTTRRTLTYE